MTRDPPYGCPINAPAIVGLSIIQAFPLRYDEQDNQKRSIKFNNKCHKIHIN